MYREELIKLLEAYVLRNTEDGDAALETLKFINSNSEIFGKANSKGHVTASAWIVNEEMDSALLTHHGKLNIWVQMGGHTEIGERILEAALREAEEESGLSDLKVLSTDIFDVDVHLIPESKKAPAHYHYDIRFLLLGNREKPLVISDESHEIKWVVLEEITNYSTEVSIDRMVRKTRCLK